MLVKLTHSCYYQTQEDFEDNCRGIFKKGTILLFLKEGKFEKRFGGRLQYFQFLYKNQIVFIQIYPEIVFEYMTVII